MVESGMLSAKVMPGWVLKREQETGVESVGQGTRKCGSCDVGHVSVGGGEKRRAPFRKRL